jgi:hypothetical protein
MRTLHNDALDALDSGRFAVRCLLKVTLDSELIIAMWDDIGNIEVDGVTYVGRPGRFTVSGVVSEKGATVPKMDVTLSGLDSEAVAIIDGYQWHQRPITCYRAVFAIDDPTGIHVMPEFSGFLDQMEWSEAADGSSTIVFRCESSAREMRRTGARTRSDTDQRTRDSSDGFFEFAASAVTTPVNWGGRPQSAKQSTKPSGLAGLFDKWF